VPAISDCRARLEALTTPLLESASGEICFLAPGRVPLGLVEGGAEPDLHSVVLTVQDPAGTAEGLRRMGFTGDREGLALGGRFVTLRAGTPARTERPLLNHLAVLVESAEAARREAEELGLEIDRVVDAANTIAVFVLGPEGILVEYVEHKPSFSLV
jgi:catechol 2,3-dioxygenase-like lactoylglutathione lyase family enzyme